MHRRTAVVLVAAWGFCAFLQAGPVLAYTPYGLMYKAFKDPRPYVQQARDDRMALALKRKLLTSGLSVDSACFLGRVQLAGIVSGEEEKDRILAIGREAAGEGMVDAYLPRAGEAGGDCKALSVRAALVGEEGGVSLKVSCVGGTAVLMGVVRSPEDGEKAVETARGVDGVEKVVTFLQAPSAGSLKREGPVRRLLDGLP